jgi:hypothetical protein
MSALRFFPSMSFLEEEGFLVSFVVDVRGAMVVEWLLTVP